MSIYSTPPLISALLFLTLGVFVFFKNTKCVTNRIFAWSCLTTFIWQFAWTILFSTKNPTFAHLLVKIGYSGIIFIPISFYHFTMSYLQEVRENRLIFVSYILGIGFLISLWVSKLFISGYHTFFWGFYPKASFLHPFYLFLLFFLAIRGLRILFIKTNQLKDSPSRHNQIKYLFLSFAIYCFATSDFFVNYGIEFYPLGFVAILISLGIIAYTIAKYRLLDIKVALTRAGIFAIVYSLILVIPFIVAKYFQHSIYMALGDNWWVLILFIGMMLAGAGPFMYNYLRRRAENIIFREQRRYQHALRELSKTMTRIRDLDKLLKVIVLTVVDTVKVSFAAIYLKDEEYNSYRLKHYYPHDVKSCFPELVPLDSGFTKVLYEEKKPLLSEEVGLHDKISLDAGLVIPCLIEDDLLGFLCLGPKPNHQMYTSDDVLVFETLSYSTSLAIENCFFWKEIEDRHRKARLQEMDTYSYSLAHEIDNPMQVVLGQADLLKKEVLDNVADEEKRKNIIDSFDFILEAARRVSGMVKAIRDFGQKTTGEFKPLKIEDVVESFAKLYYPQFKEKIVIFEKTSNLKNPVFIRGEKPELMQALVILANNSVHAMTGLKEKKVFLKIEVVNHDRVRICFSDNGYGIKKEMLEVIFTPFTTTKASTEGTGMGLYNAKKIIERHKGKIWADSDGPGKGATFVIELPIAKDIMLEDLEDKDKGKRLF